VRLKSGTLTARRLSVLIEAVLLCAVAKTILLLCPRLRTRVLGNSTAIEAALELPNSQLEAVKHTKWALETLGRYSPFLRQCLAQAIAGRWMLKRRGVASSLVLGLRKGGPKALLAHAWLCTGSTIVVGGEKYSGFTVVARFDTPLQSSTLRGSE
jgi:hypothetical protein